MCKSRIALIRLNTRPVLRLKLETEFVLGIIPISDSHDLIGYLI